MAWAKRHPDELVVLLVSRCFDGGSLAEYGCNSWDEVGWTKPFTDLGMHVVDDYDGLNSMSLGLPNEAWAQKLAISHSVGKPPATSPQH